MASPAIKLLTAAGGSQFNDPPPDVTSQVARWWASDLVGTYANNDPVDSWTDDVGSFTLSATSTARPTFLTSGINGRPAVDFDGTTDILRYAAASAVSNNSLGCVVAVVVLGDSTGTVWGSCDEATNLRYLLGQYTTFTNVNIMINQANNGGADLVRGSTTLATSTAYALEWTSSGFAYELIVDNATESKTVFAGADTGDWFSDVTLRDNFTIGGVQDSGGASSFFTGQLAFLLVADAQLSTGDRTALYNNWITPYYGI
jgi:hypothetical protein